MLAKIGDNLHSGVMLIGLEKTLQYVYFGRFHSHSQVHHSAICLQKCLEMANPNLGGLLGSTFGLLVGIGLGRGHIFPLIWTQMKV